MALPNAAISYDRFHVVAMAVDAMDKVRQTEMRGEPKAVAKALGTNERKTPNFIAIAYLRMSKLKHLPAHPFALAAPK